MKWLMRIDFYGDSHPTETRSRFLVEHADTMTLAIRQTAAAPNLNLINLKTIDVVEGFNDHFSDAEILECAPAPADTDAADWPVLRTMDAVAAIRAVAVSIVDGLEGHSIGAAVDKKRHSEMCAKFETTIKHAIVAQLAYPERSALEIVPPGKRSP